MNICILQGTSDKNIVAVFGSLTLSAIELEKALSQAIEYARDMGVDDDDVIGHAAETLEKDDIVYLTDDAPPSWGYVSILV